MAPIKPPRQRIRHIGQNVVTLVPEPAKVVPRCPKGLLEATQQVWRGFWKSTVSNAVDLDADQGKLDRWIHTVDEYYLAIKALRAENTRIIQRPSGIAVHPLTTYIANLQATIERMEGEFGMGPMSRTKLGIQILAGVHSLEQMNAQIDGPKVVEVIE